MITFSMDMLHALMIFYVLNVEDTSEKSIYNIETKKFKSNDLNATYLWHCHLGHIN